MIQETPIEGDRALKIPISVCRVPGSSSLNHRSPVSVSDPSGAGSKKTSSIPSLPEYLIFIMIELGPICNSMTASL